MGCDIHTRGEARTTGGWKLLGRVFHESSDHFPYEPITREMLEELTDGQLVDGFSYEGQPYWVVRDQWEERKRKALSEPPGSIGGVRDREYYQRAFDPDQDWTHKAFWDGLDAEAKAAFAVWHAGDEHWRQLYEALTAEIDKTYPLDDGMRSEAAILEMQRRRRVHRADRHRLVTLTPAARESVIATALAHKPWGADDDEGITLSLERGEGESAFKTREPFGDRSYNVFAMLANVRNGGFRGEPSRLQPLSEPRGIPNDISDEGREWMESFGVDGHSHSYFTLAELEAVDWDGKTIDEWGVIKEDEFLRLRDAGTHPSMWSRSTSGRGIRVFTPEGYDAWVERGRPWIASPSGRSWLDDEVYITPELLNTLLVGEIQPRDPADDPLRAAPWLMGKPAPEGEEPFGLKVGPVSVRTDATGTLVVDPRDVDTEIRAYVRGEWSYTWAENAGGLMKALADMHRVADEMDIGTKDIRLLMFFDN